MYRREREKEGEGETFRKVRNVRRFINGNCKENNFMNIVNMYSVKRR